MKRAIYLGAIFLGLLIVCADARAALDIGVRGGYAHATGDVFEGSGDVGGGGLYGIVAGLGFTDALQLELAYEHYTKDFSFDEAVHGGTIFFGDGKYEDQAYLLTGKVQFFRLVPTPIGLYGGAGVSLHSLDITVDSGEATVPDFGEKKNEFEWHLVAGAGLRVPGLPLRAYGEYRYQNITGSADIRFSSLYAGVNLVLE